jgi:hypothetical protein
VSARHLALALCLFCAACRAPASLGSGCLRDSDCGASLVCALGRCRTACRATRDCSPGTYCLVEPSTGIGACSLPVVDACGDGCPDGFACQDGNCVNVCDAVARCPDGVCIDGMCAPIVGDAGPLPDGGLDAASDAGPACHGPGCDPVIALASPGGRTYAVTESGALWAWGNAVHALLGDGLETHGTCAACSPTPVRALGPDGAPFADVVEVSAAEDATCVRRRDGTAWCWGRNYTSQLGAGVVGDQTVPQQVLAVTATGMAPLDDVRAIRSGRYHSCVIRGDARTVWCWGGADHGQCGTGSATSPDIATQATELGGGVVDVRLGDESTLALAADGSIRGVGTDYCSVLGGATTDADVVMALAAPATGATALADSRSGNVCAVLMNGDVSCWGQGTALLPTTPTTACTGCPSACTASAQTVAFGGASDPIVRLSALGDAFVAWSASGATRIWGGLRTRVPAPVALGAPSGRAVIDAAGGFAEGVGGHGCVLDDAGDVYCWGDDDLGQLGTGVVGAVSGTTAVAWP